MTAIEVHQAVAVHRTPDSEVVALRGADLKVEDGELVALVGPSGSGKSTLLALLAGVTRPTAGRVIVLGRDIGRLSERDRSTARRDGIGLLLQGLERNLLPFATAAANVLQAGSVTRRSRRDLTRAAQEMLEAVGIDPASRQPVRLLSGGEQQRVALAAALISRPALLLVDEPTSQLDQENATRVIELLRTARDEHGATVLMVTHDAAAAAGMDRQLSIRDGRIGAESRGGQDYTVIGLDGTLQLPEEAADRFPPGSRARIVTRPTHLELHPAPNADMGNR